MLVGIRVVTHILRQGILVHFAPPVAVLLGLHLFQPTGDTGHTYPETLSRLQNRQAFGLSFP